MRQSSRNLDALEVTFDDPNAVANGGLVLPMAGLHPLLATGLGKVLGVRQRGQRA